MISVAKIEVPKTWKHSFSGKVREIFEVPQGRLALVATDRVSAFDWVLPNEVADKGKVLTQLAKFWFEELRPIFPNHWEPKLEAMEAPAALAPRTMIVKKLDIFPFEFIVRGHLAGSAWKSYQKSRRVGDHELPDGLRWADPFAEPLLTPTTKAREAGAHDEDVSWKTVEQSLGKERSQAIAQALMEIFKQAGRRLAGKGIILVDTKFELGQDQEGRVLLADEALTPDSSRFWWTRDWERYRKTSPAPADLPSLDKQVIRDYLEKTIRWDKKPPVPYLPHELIQKTRDTYLELFRAVTGREPVL